MIHTLCQFTLSSALLTTPFNSTCELKDSIQEDSQMVEAETLCPQADMRLASTAAKVLCAIAQARGSLHAKNVPQAKIDLEHARALIDLIKAMHPTTRVKDYLWVAKKHLDYESMEKVAQDLIPIDLALANLEYLIPVEAAKSHLEAAHKSLTNKDRVAAKKYLEAVENALVYTEVDLPLAATKHHIGMAQELLTHNKPKKAEATLEDAEAGVEFISLRMDGHPIGPARQSLWHGMEAYAAGNFDAVKIDLNQAGVWLTRAVQTRDEGVKAEATALAGELRTLAGGIRQKGSVVATALQGLWRKTTALTERETAVAVVRWQNFRTQPATDALFDNRTKIKVDLTETNFYLTYAEIFEFTTHEPNKAQMALEKAQMHLRTAEKLANGRGKVKIEALEQESALIHKALMKEGQSDMSRYIKVKNDVHQILQELSW